MQIPFQGRRTRRTERLNATTNQRRWPAETIEWDRKYRTRNNWTRRSNEKTEWDHQANERIKRASGTDWEVEPTEKWNSRWMTSPLNGQRELNFKNEKMFQMWKHNPIRPDDELLAMTIERFKSRLSSQTERKSLSTPFENSIRNSDSDFWFRISQNIA